MNRLLNFIILYIFSILIQFSGIVNANETTIRIITFKPDVINEKNWKDYSSLENYFQSSVDNSTSLQDIRINFSYISNVDYKSYISVILSELKKSTYDMMILDGEFLFSDMAFIESNFIKKLFNERKFHQYFQDLTPILQEAKESHNPKLLQSGIYDHKLYGLPFEIDFDLLYYHKENVGKEPVNDLEKLSWNDMLNTILSSNNTESIPGFLSLGLGENNELLSLFVEYIHEYYDLSKEKDNIKKQFPETSKDLLTSFREFALTAIYPLSKSLKETIKGNLEEAYDFFQNNQTIFFKGKASHYQALAQKEEKIQTTLYKKAAVVKVENSPPLKSEAILPPHNQSVLRSKYLVINANSKINSQILRKIALLLTSKEMQSYRAEQYGSLPTFDFDQKKSDPVVQKYCQDHTELCSFIQKMDPIGLKETFQSQYSTPFMEIQLLLPPWLLKFLYDDSRLPELQNIFENIENLVMKRSENKNIPWLFVYLPMIVFTLVCLGVMFLLYRHRNHPYLKLYSPILCIIIIFGFIMGILSPPFMIQNDSLGKCHFKYVYDNINTTLVLIPMVVISYRVYSIYNNTSKVVIGKKLKNHRLLFYIFVFLLVMIIFSLAVISFLKFYIVSYGDITTYRHPQCQFDGGHGFFFMDRIIYLFMFITMFIIILKTGKISKQYGEMRYIIIMIFISVLENTMNYLLYKLPTKGYFKNFVFVFIAYMLGYCFCVYLLVGSKLIYAIRNPQANESFSSDYDRTQILPTKSLLSDKNKSSLTSSNSTSSSTFPSTSFSTSPSSDPSSPLS